MDSIQSVFNESLQRLTGGIVGQSYFLLAVSGGIDSICMAELFRRSELEPRFAIAHVNFSLRGEESDGDMDSVIAWGEKYGIKVFTRTFDTTAYAAEHSISTQMAARELRYGFFRELMDKYGFNFLSVAHNENDSVETVFLNITRGTGIKGLSGIPSKNGRIIRPMLSVPRSMISEFIMQNDIPYRNDHTNFESHYYRNRLRNIIFPEFEKINPSFLATVSRNTEYIAEAAEIIEDMASEIKAKVCFSDGEETFIDRALLLAETHFGYWLYAILSEYGFGSSQLKEMERCLISGQVGKLFRSGTNELVLGSDKIRIRPLREEDATEFVIEGPGEYNFKGYRFRLEYFSMQEGFCPKTDNSSILYLDIEKFRLPVLCRSWQPADRFRPFGMKYGMKKLGDFFKDLKIDRLERQSRPVLVCPNGDIACIPGLRIDDRYKVTSSTKIVAAVRCVG